MIITLFGSARCTSWHRIKAYVCVSDKRIGNTFIIYMAWQFCQFYTTDDDQSRTRARTVLSHSLVGRYMLKLSHPTQEFDFVLHTLQYPTGPSTKLKIHTLHYTLKCVNTWTLFRRFF